METYAVYRGRKIVSKFTTTETMCEAANFLEYLYLNNMINVAIFTDKCCWNCILDANKRTHHVTLKESPSSVAKHDETAPYPMQFADDVGPQHVLGDKILTPNCTTLVLKGLYMLPEIIFGLKKMKMDIKCEHLEDSHLTNKHFYIRSTLQPDGSNISKVEREYIPLDENEQVRKAYVKPMGLGSMYLT
ncbi:unnamed protein product [Adineta steineri]|uniref:Uncharacterized protein n=1 Tax=Adineta steineri TaxID=433720 RepID=A0A819Q2T1_9BILA|nr:unnamed protein product [Adineta steineri]CAF4017561.1 unnamed protein product [Adineta steineri]